MICLDMLKQPHLLIAGASGSGKSVLLNTLIYTCLYNSPCRSNLILIDPKMVELSNYKHLPHTLIYARDKKEYIEALGESVILMRNRYKTMDKLNIKMWPYDHTYVVIDEFADLIIRAKKECLSLLIELASLGRAAGIHLVIASQRPTRDIISGAIKVNIDARIALRCPTAQDSRNIINMKGAESLPRVGFGYYLTPETMPPKLIKIPLTPPEELATRVEWWEKQKNHKSILKRITAWL